VRLRGYCAASYRLVRTSYCTNPAGIAYIEQPIQCIAKCRSMHRTGRNALRLSDSRFPIHAEPTKDSKFWDGAQPQNTKNG